MKTTTKIILGFTAFILLLYFFAPLLVFKAA